ncbi:MAG: FAD-dependent monooxygenase [Verrucomicrobiales bacterium]|nr:FAD-dependent monooxygenase [Verrucomicrobiales bacterium]
MSALSNKVDVLVIGAGPCGLLSALALARGGIEVEIVDRARRSSAQSYACGIHSATLELLGTLGLAQQALESGFRVDTVGLYEGAERRGELLMSELKSGGFPFLLVLPQDRLEELLEQELRQRGVRVRWGHRLDTLHQDENGVSATVETLAMTSVGYPYARSEEAVEKETEVHARYVIGADGAASHVRQILNLPCERHGEPTAFEVVEFEPVSDVGREVRIVFGPGTQDALWPQSSSIARWSLQRTEAEAATFQSDGGDFALGSTTETPDKEAIVARILERAPWFKAGIKEVDWATVVGFDSMMARNFGVGRVWLTGDAGHQTSPIGMQSMNVGLREAADLAGRIQRALRQGAAPEIFAEYERQRREEWSLLLGLKGGLSKTPKTTPWANSQRRRLLGSLPASGADLATLARQLGLELA